MLHHTLSGRDDGPVLVLANSLGTTLEMWDGEAAALGATLHLLRYDQLGHGRSPVPPGPYSVARLAEELVALLDALGLERVAFCGLSLGGMVGMWLAANRPERVELLVLCSTTAKVDGEDFWNGRARTARSDGMSRLAVEATTDWFSEPFRGAQPETIAGFHTMVASTPAEGYAACCEAIRDWDGRDLLADIRAPTLVIGGADDPATPPSSAEQIAAGIPGAELRIVERAAHLTNVEQPEMVTELILGHIVR